MKVRFIILAFSFVLVVLLTSCGASSKTCPAYGDASTEMQDEVKS